MMVNPARLMIVTDPARLARAPERAQARLAVNLRVRVQARATMALVRVLRVLAGVLVRLTVMMLALPLNLLLMALPVRSSQPAQMLVRLAGAALTVGSGQRQGGTSHWIAATVRLTLARLLAAN
jgi:hypothetical protein